MYIHIVCICCFLQSILCFKFYFLFNFKSKSKLHRTMHRNALNGFFIHYHLTNQIQLIEYFGSIFPNFLIITIHNSYMRQWSPGLQHTHSRAHFRSLFMQLLAKLVRGNYCPAFERRKRNKQKNTNQNQIWTRKIIRKTIFRRKKKHIHGICTLINYNTCTCTHTSNV